uniref:Putative secreted protein n=1 Tax=Anopheles marajoara TaxID=58244 RepID=A0A2M4C6M0_9DIPT
MGSFSWAICFLTIASNAISGVKRPTRIPWMLRMANEISRRSSFSSHDILTISKRNRSWKIRLILAPPDSSLVLTSAEPEPSIVRSKSDCSCWIICNMAFVLMLGSSGRKCLNCSTSFSSVSNCFCRRSRSAGSVSRI